MKKGFTLVELLAVIVILAVIAIIATPLITGVIEKSKKGAAESSAYGYVEAVDNYRVMALLDGKESLSNKTYTVEELEDYGVTVKGDKPTSGYVTIEDGKVSDYELQFGSYVVTYNETSKKAEVNKGESTDTNDTEENTDIKDSDVEDNAVYTAYAVGDEVTIDGIGYHVIKTSSSTSPYVTLLRDESIVEMTFDENSGTDYETSTLKTYLDSTYKATFGDKEQYIQEITLLDYGTYSLIDYTYIDMNTNFEEGTMLYLFKNYRDIFFDINPGQIQTKTDEYNHYNCGDEVKIESFYSIWTKSRYSSTNMMLAGFVQYSNNATGEVCGYKEDFVNTDTLEGLHIVARVRPVITIHKDAIQS